MIFNDAQLAVIRNFLQTDVTAQTFFPVGVTPETIDHVGFKAFLLANTGFKVWKTSTPVSDIQDNIVWSRYTPINTNVLATVEWSNWLSQCNNKMMILQTLLMNRDFNNGISTSKVSIRLGLQDALTDVPSGALGAPVAAGWQAVKLVIQRDTNRLEQLLATGTGTAAVPGNLTYEGFMPDNEILSLVFNDLGIRII